MKKKGVRRMATQMAATPVLKGEDAKNLLESLNRKPTQKSKDNGKKLINYFKAFEREK